MHKYQVREVEYKHNGFLRAQVNSESSVEINKVLEEMSSQGWKLMEVKTTFIDSLTHSVLLFFKKEV